MKRTDIEAKVLSVLSSEYQTVSAIARKAGVTWVFDVQDILMALELRGVVERIPQPALCAYRLVSTELSTDERSKGHES